MARSRAAAVRMAAVKRPLLILVAIVAVLGVSFLVARWLNNDTVERARVAELLRAQARGDAGGDARAARRLRRAALRRAAAQPTPIACAGRAS